MSLTRVFISAEISERDEISTIQEKIFAYGNLDFRNAKKVDRDNFHFTLLFIGEVDSASLDQITGIVSSIKFTPLNSILQKSVVFQILSMPE